MARQAFTRPDRHAGRSSGSAGEYVRSEPAVHLARTPGVCEGRRVRDLLAPLLAHVAQVPVLAEHLELRRTNRGRRNADRARRSEADTAHMEGTRHPCPAC